MIGTSEVWGYLRQHGPKTKRELNREFQGRGSTFTEMSRVLEILLNTGEVRQEGISPYVQYHAVET